MRMEVDEIGKGLTEQRPQEFLSGKFSYIKDREGYKRLYAASEGSGNLWVIIPPQITKKKLALCIHYNNQ